VKNSHSVHEISNLLHIVPTGSEMLESKERAVVHFHEFKGKYYSYDFYKPFHFTIWIRPVLEVLISTGDSAEDNSEYKVEQQQISKCKSSQIHYVCLTVFISKIYLN